MIVYRKSRVGALVVTFLVGVMILSLLPGCGTSGTSADNSKNSNTSSNTSNNSNSNDPSKNNESSQSKEVDFPTKDITFIVPVSPGGGFDTNSRLLAQYLPKYLPKEVNVIVKNMPGGEWNIGIGAINRAKPDGYTIGVFNIPGNVVNQILGTAEYDLTKMTWIGRITDTVYVGALSPKSPYKSLKDLQDASKEGKTIKVGAVGLSSTAGLGSLIALQEMGINNATFVTHPGSSEAVMAAVRGDVDYVQYPYPTLKKFIYDSHELNPIVVFNSKRLEDLPDVPTIKDAGYEGLLDVVKMDYLVAGTPGIPEDVSNILKDAFQKAVSDPDFLEKMKANGLPANPADAEEAASIVQRSLDNFAKYKDLVLENTK